MLDRVTDRTARTSTVYAPVTHAGWVFPVHEEAAARWIVTLSGGDVDAETLGSFERWMEADTRHALAFDTLAAVWGMMVPCLSKDATARHDGDLV